METNKTMDWAELLGRPPVAVDPTLAAPAVCGESVFITGAGGSIGYSVARAALAGQPRSLVLLDLSEAALYKCYRKLSALSNNSECEVIPATGNITDARFLAHLFRQHRPDLIFHAAAYKHVPLMEKNPFSA
ncbi:MAG TPA: polysaccharide biosynthesis protein, partial [Silvibacterium sp.]|nr:polysaccharide biosynthesis protein [Silvibacterium sp.]